MNANAASFSGMAAQLAASQAVRSLSTAVATEPARPEVPRLTDQLFERSEILSEGIAIVNTELGDRLSQLNARLQCLIDAVGSISNRLEL